MEPNVRDYYTAGELAKMFMLSKQTILYYDRKGILKPKFVTENGYRYYSVSQYLTLEIIINLRKLDIPISEIQSYLRNRSPENLRKLLERKDQTCLETIRQNERIRSDIAIAFHQFEKADNSRLDQIMLNYRQEKDFYLSPLKNEIADRDVIFTLARHNLKVFSKRHFKERAIGWIISKEDFLSRGRGRAVAFFSTVNRNHFHLDDHIFTRPGGFYLTLRFKGTFHSRGAETSQKLKDFMIRNALDPIGDLYVMPLRNHWMTSEPAEYLNQISLQVSPLSAAPSLEKISGYES